MVELALWIVAAIFVLWFIFAVLVTAISYVVIGYSEIDKQKRSDFWAWVLLIGFALYIKIVFFG